MAALKPGPEMAAGSIVQEQARAMALMQRIVFFIIL